MIRLGRNQMSENLFYQAFDLVSAGIYLCRPGFIAFSNINCAKFSANFFAFKKVLPDFSPHRIALPSKHTLLNVFTGTGICVSGSWSQWPKPRHHDQDHLYSDP
ncbi:hypothetical protein [Lacticaseibacillus rhamnosus]|uniref:hypothetical protein n=1 Tax=Lacticaseibacillus rhamnosus TaxID=47715 RepID=UPI0015D6D8ED|nr:hypothetical protein [Lacticaseibacillus rhamnosus]